MKNETIEVVCPNPKCNEISNFKIQSPIWWYLANYEKMLIGITSKLKNGEHVFFAEIDGKDEDYNDIIEAKETFMNEAPFHNLICVETPRGYHLISLNNFSWSDCLNMYSKLLENNNIDKTHAGYSIARGFSTLRLSKKNPKEKEFRLYSFKEGARQISEPHLNIYKRLMNRKLENISRKYFDEGFELVGYPYKAEAK